MLNAHLKRLHLQSPQPETLAKFYARAYGMQRQSGTGAAHCGAAGRETSMSTGGATRLHYAWFCFDDAHSWSAFEKRCAALPKAALDQFPELPPDAIGALDPEGNCMVFSLEPAAQPEANAAVAGTDAAMAESDTALPAAVLQHFALRTQHIDAMRAFYVDALGFVLSDNVLDGDGALKACFLRVSALHHSLALFGAPVACFDHQSFETPNWDALKQWADHMSAQRIEIVWGVGRHGPGNDVFFMVRDPDGNLAEISSEIETCEPNRPVGIWRHEERTLNLWGKAIMRG